MRTPALIGELTLVLLRERISPSSTVAFTGSIGTVQQLAPEQRNFLKSLERACRVVFRWWWRSSTCLERTRAVAEILGRRGIPAQVWCGVSRCDGEVFSAHAWLTVGDTVVVGPALSEAVTFRPVGEACKAAAKGKRA